MPRSPARLRAATRRPAEPVHTARARAAYKPNPFPDKSPPAGDTRCRLSGIAVRSTAAISLLARVQPAPSPAEGDSNGPFANRPADPGGYSPAATLSRILLLSSPGPFRPERPREKR